jgi:hypothetical protein
MTDQANEEVLQEKSPEAENANPTEIVNDIPEKIQKLSDLAEKEIIDKPISDGQKWYIREGVEGVGECPPWLLEKYGFNQEKQAQAYPELQKLLKAHSGAPDKYDLTPQNPEKFKFDENNPQLRSFLELAKENHVNQEFVRQVLALYENEMLTNTLDVQKETQELGENYAQRLGKMLQWGGNNLDQNNYGMFEKIINTFGSQAYNMFAELRSKGSVELPTPLNSETAINVQDTIESLENEMRENYNKYCNDPSYRKNWMARMERISPD